MFSPYDFNYTWAFTESHNILCAAFAALALLAWRLRWPRGLLVVFLAAASWALAGSLIVHRLMLANEPLVLPTAAFLPEGRGRVLDMGAGSGRSTLMVALGRPGSRVTALDIYRGSEYGIGDNTPDRLIANARVAGVADRVDVKVGDMRQMPFDAGTFDAGVSAYAIDHLRGDGAARALAEAARVIRVRGQFLLMVVNVDWWLRVAFPSIHGHGYFSTPQDVAKWRNAMTTAGFDVVEIGTQPGTLYFLGTKLAPSGSDAVTQLPPP